MRRVPLLARHVRIRVRLQDRVDDAGEPVQLRPPDRLRPAVARRRRIAQHLLHRPAVDAEPTARLVMAQTLVDNRQSNRRIELHAVHLPPLVATDKGPWLAQFCAAATGPPGRSAWSIIPPPLTVGRKYCFPENSFLVSRLQRRFFASPRLIAASRTRRTEFTGEPPRSTGIRVGAPSRVLLDLANSIENGVLTPLILSLMSGRISSPGSSIKDPNATIAMRATTSLPHESR